MRIEGQHQGPESAIVRFCERRTDDRPVTEVNTIEITDCDQGSLAELIGFQGFQAGGHDSGFLLQPKSRVARIRGPGDQPEQGSRRR